jgi:hypothetical protein
MLIPFGILSAAGAGGVAGTFELVATNILGSSQSSVVFDTSSLGSSYKHLQLRIVAKTNGGDANEAMILRFNSDTATNYGYHILRGNGSAVSSVNESSIDKIFFQRFAGNATTGFFGSSVMDILDAFSTTKNKTTRNLGGVATGVVSLDSGLWRSTSAITTISLLPQVGTNFLTGSRFSLYGIKG